MSSDPPAYYNSPGCISASECTNGQVCYASEAGFYDSAKSTSNVVIDRTGSVTNTTINPSTVSTLFGSAYWEFDTTTIEIRNGIAGALYTGVFVDFDLLVVTDGYSTLPDGTKYGPTIGALALGGPNFNETWGNYPPYGWNGTLLTSSLFAQGHAPSNSYGMHIGSTVMGIPGSLNIGGYDKTRVLEPVSSQPYELNILPIDLLDIGIGVAAGQSPFTFTSLSGLMASGNSSIGLSMPVLVESRVPYLYLPQSTCDAIAKNLPVTFQKNLGLYFWNVEDTQYKTIITSPSFLAFTFRLSQSTSANFTINMPFSLLNLTLAAPLAQTATQYFPCSPRQGPSGKFTLGRAFMQAAFVGVNWVEGGNGNWFLGQAPGPNTPSSGLSTVINPSDLAINGSTSSWKDTWKGFWDVIEAAASNTSSSTSTGSNTTPASNTSTRPGKSSTKPGISKGVIASVAVGGVAAIIIFAMAGFFILRRLTKHSKNTAGDDSSPHFKSELHADQPEYAVSRVHGIDELENQSPARKIGELWAGGGSGRPAEMSGEHKKPAEMPA